LSAHTLHGAYNTTIISQGAADGISLKYQSNALFGLTSITVSPSHLNIFLNITDVRITPCIAASNTAGIE